MTKKFCDCCGKEIKGMGAPISVPCHLYSFANNVTGKSGYRTNEGDFIPDKQENAELNKIDSSTIKASLLKANSFVLGTNNEELTIKIGEGYFWYRGEKIEDTKKVYELFADFLQKQRCNY